MPENWLSYACFYINSLSIKTIRPTKNFIYYYPPKIPLSLKSSCPLSTQTKKHLKGKVLPSRCHLFIYGWINGHNSVILAPVNFYGMPFYSSHASDLNGMAIWRNHVTQNGCWEQVLHGLYTTATQHARFIALCQVSPCIYKNIPYTKQKLI